MHMCTLYCIWCMCTFVYLIVLYNCIGANICVSSEELQQYLGIRAAINFCTFAPINFTQPRYSNTCTISVIICCISTVFVFLPQNFVAFVCIGSSDVHHPESQPSIWHFHGFQVIANWRLAAIARTLELLQKSKQKIRNSNGMWWGWKLLKALWSQKAFSQITDNCCDFDGNEPIIVAETCIWRHKNTGCSDITAAQPLVQQ